MNEAEIYRKIINATGHNDLARIYQESLELISGIPDVDVIMVYIVDTDTNAAVLEAHYNLDQSYLERARTIESGKGITWKILRSSKLLLFDDVQKADELGEAGRSLGIRSALGVPVIADNQCMGVIWFFSFKPSAYGDNTVKLLSSTAKLLGRNISRVKQREEIQRKNNRLSILAQLSIFLNESTNIKKISDILKHLMEHIDLVDNKAIYLVEEEESKKVARLKLHNGIPSEIVSKYSELKYPNGITWKCIDEGEVQYYPKEKILNSEIGEVASTLGITCFVSVPIRIDRRIIGVCNFISFNRSHYTDDDLEYIKALGSQIGSAFARIELYENMKKASITDALSGLYNSGYFHESLKQYFSGSQRTESKISLIVLDLNDFKKINDKYGHLAGDSVISGVGKALANNVRKMDIPARYGGDEFAVILPNTGYTLSKSIAARIHRALTSLTVETEGAKISPGISIGISTFENGIESSSDLIKMADKAMYAAKKKGGTLILHYRDISPA